MDSEIEGLQDLSINGAGKDVGQSDMSPMDMVTVSGDEPGKDRGEAQIVLPNREWKEITPEFFKCVKELNLGELVHDNMFGLFDAMSAIEMMDPKMDAGMCCNKETTPLNFQTAVESGTLKLANLECRESIGIIDAVYACTVSWLEGHSMAQTVLTCLYLHHPHRIEDKSMKAFSCAVHKLVNLIRNFILRARVYEEEDFQPSTYGYDLCMELSETKACNMLKSAEEDLVKRIKDVESDKEKEEINALVCRLKFTRLLLQCLVALYPTKTNTSWHASNATANANVSPTKTEMIDIVKTLNGALELTQIMEKTIDCGTQPEPGSDTPNPIGFSMMVNQRLLPPTFPRYTKIKARSTCILYLAELIQRLKHACKIVHCTNYHSALNFFMDFSKKFGPCLLSRSILQTLYLPSHDKVFGTKKLTEVLKESAKAFIAPPILMPDNPLSTNAAALNCVDSFFAYNEHTFSVLFEICGYNRARQRDKLGIMLSNFLNLQDEAERIDAYLHTLFMKNENPRHHLACFGTWVLYHCLRAMSFFLLSGLELELYSVHEYMYIFWYLYQFLFGWIVSALTRADTFIVEQDFVNDPKGAKGSQKKPKVKKRKGKTDAKEIIFNQAMQNMCGGYYKALGGFIAEERIPEPLPMFDNEKVRFEHRFAPFATLVTPPPMAYSDFKLMKTYLLKSPPEELYASAAKHFHEARVLLESYPNPDEEWHEIIKVAKMNFVMMNLLASGLNWQAKAAPEFDFSCHRYFPIIKQRK
ncbi:N-alpha-acetyltransferase 35, NatC auxiliary subunit isoform X2 [Toxorhynchites rutilus septentrionalis]|uniref:N-alpha-acetyltransferase 35, NatC auxiliary subunit isoform X2 n=1 Tax=Toxorhynchites rutilus septentrionalis TaxID=329112 RepID=UPI002479718C|nr:N-alpha-acetyltransferase 35, NatC auxiliary subunit isoform X2 [Toxorhynchites rutilus septentrionalis]